MSEQEQFALLESQRSVYLSQILNPQSTEFTIAIRTEIATCLDIRAFARAAKHVFLSTAALRLKFLETSHGPVQYVENEGDPDLRIIEIHDDSKVADLSEKLIETPFDLSQNPPFRWLLMCGAEKTVLLELYHHAALDGMAAWVVSHRLADSYRACVEGTPLPFFNGQPIATLVAQEDAYCQSKFFQTDKAYWLEKLKLQEPTRSWSLLPPRFKTKDPIVQKLSFEATAYKAIMSLCDNPRRLEYIFSAAAVMLQRFIADENTLKFGCPLLGRSYETLKNTPFMQSTEACLVVDVQRETTARALMRQLEREVLLSLRHQRFSYERIRTALNLKNGDPDLFALTLNFMPMSESIDFGPFPTTVEFLRMGPVRDIALTIVHNSKDGFVDLYLEGHASRYNKKEIAHFLDLLECVITRIKDHGLDLPICSYLQDLKPSSLIGSIEPLPSGRTLQSQVEKAFRHADHQTAIYYDGQKMTYTELNQSALTIANQIEAIAQNKSIIVAIAVGRNIHLPTAFIGAILSGYTFVPIDPDYPEAQVKAILNDCRPSLIITELAYSSLFAADDCQLLFLDGEVMGSIPFTKTKRRPSEDDIAVILYTSGSTGRPKGVELKHDALTSKSLDNAEIWNFEKGDCFAHTSSISADPTLHQILIPIFQNGACAIVSRDTLLSGKELSALVKQANVTHLDILPSLGAALIDDFDEALPSLKTIIFGGEVLKPALLSNYQRRFSHCSIFNMYGPTEICVDATFFKVRAETIAHAVPLGNALPHYGITIENEWGEILPRLLIGEIIVSGPMIAKGYFLNPEITKQQFFRRDQTAFYRTGDLGFIDLDGTLFFVGRKDDQLKIRGFRIPITDIESELLLTSLMSEVCVRPEVIGEQEVLVCYYKSKSKKATSTKLILRSLSERLPPYMLPSRFIEVDSFTYLTNGKIDRKSRFHSLQSDKLELSTDSSTLEKLAKILRRVLGTDVYENDHFFSIGGNSLTAIRVVSLISKKMGIQIHIRDLFANPIIADLAAFLDARLNGQDKALEHSAKLIELTRSEDNNQDAKDTLFVVSPMGAVPFLYKPLLNGISNQWSILELNDLSIAGAGDINSLSHELSEKIAKQCKATSPTLLGWSHGGVLAHAISAALEAKGIALSHLILLDTYFPHTTLGMAASMDAAFSKYISQFDAPDEWKESFQKASRETDQHLRNYQPHRISSSLIYIRASDNVITNLPEMLAELTLGTATIVDVPETHFEMLKNPSLDTYRDIFNGLESTSQNTN